MVRGMLPNFAFLVLFSAPSRDHLLGEEQQADVTACQTPMHGTKGDIKDGESRLGSTRLPRQPTLIPGPKRPISPSLESCPNMATLCCQDAGELEGSRLYWASTKFVLQGHMVGCFAPALVWPD